MSELLTTGQMIEKLKVDEKAEVVGGLLEGLKVTKTDYKEVILKGVNEVLKLSYHVMHAKWRILPNYVSFEEAMEALKRGKIVHFHAGEEKREVRKGYLINEWFNSFSFDELMEKTWTIEDE